MVTTTHVGIVGVGGIGSAYAAAVESSTTLHLAAVCDADVDRAREAAGADVPAFATADAMVERGLCEMIIVATPPDSHPGVASSILRSGVDVLCEKPFSIDVSRAIDMFTAAGEHDRSVAMASKFRYVDDIARARQMIIDGRIGDPVTVAITFASRVDMAHRWNSDPAVAGGGVLIDNGTHAVDIVRYLLGPITRVSAMRGISHRGFEVEDTGVVLAETADRAIATITVSWSIAPHNPFYVTIHGTQGSIDIGWQGSRVRDGATGEWVPFGTGYAKLDALRANVENFANARRGSEPMRISRSDVLASVAAVAAIYEAIDTGQWIHVQQPTWVESPQADVPLESELVTRAG